MPITDRAATAILSSLTEGVWTQLSANPQPVEHGFDTLDVVWICDFRATVKTALEVAAAFPLGMRYGSADFWLRAAVPERLGGNVWKVAAHYEGRISAAKPLSVRMQSSQEVFDIASFTYGVYEDIPANVRECSPSVEIGYVLVGVTPPTHLVGLAGTPAVSPAVRSGLWGALSLQRINFPSGWVFTDTNVDLIAGSDPATTYVRESWQYYLEQLPA